MKVIMFRKMYVVLGCHLKTIIIGKANIAGE